MEKRIIGRGVLLGALGGLLAFVFARILAEPIIGRAIDYESGRDDAQMALDKAAGRPMPMEGAELFTRDVQANIGLGFGVIVFGVAMGALFAVVYTVCLGRVGALRSRTLALLVAAGMFATLYAVPFLKYPANPPSIGHPETIKERTGLYVAMVVLTGVLLLGAIWLGRKLGARLDTWTATIAAGVAFVVAIGVVMVLLPPLGHLSANHAYGDFDTETPRPLTDPTGRIVYPGFPADDLFHFRLYSFAAQAILWLVIGVGFAWLAPRLLGEDRETNSATATAG
ncbi:CbtA family protein [Nocardia terpenica]|uniref:CbtA family protein n=1 Tax=Nocardia terpenica TaxID=455432 RepID=UPI001895F228|nr:CbtA family protein [Nocardia terpenica]MBF6065493.1 CbtA family protein [Nocardia terpenica]MBF6108705.1 CbtA family protein [Nocardia terpenica]MBF6115735.1 CbtA family protein [Nocardia terpenica]MBF6122738.1 CbtA family protein [Nocardia terpenica]MBF6155910.1 CbtA family protein [Nocardia terpenica]